MLRFRLPGSGSQRAIAQAAVETARLNVEFTKVSR